MLTDGFRAILFNSTNLAWHADYWAEDAYF
jgi:hypothetical protein